jgi:hypothetical protein
MHPELLSYLVAERHRDLAAARSRWRSPDGRAARRAHPRSLPRFRVSWTRMTLCAGTGRGRGRSWVIVISATRTL